MAAGRGTRAGPRLGDRTPLGPVGAGAGTRGGHRRRERHACRGTAPGLDRRRGPSVRGGDVLGRASLLHACLPERPVPVSWRKWRASPGARSSWCSRFIRVAWVTRGFASGSSSGQSWHSTCRSSSATSLRTRSSPCVPGASIPPRSFGGTWWRPGCGSGRGGSGRCCPAAPWWSPGGSWSQPSLGVQRHELRLTGAMSETRLSFVIPARNEEALIGEALEAILASVARASGISRNDLWLPDTSFEVIVADDGSEDATAAVVGTLRRRRRRATGPVRGPDLRRGAQRRGRGQLRAGALLRRRGHHRSGDGRRPHPRAPRGRGQVPGSLSTRIPGARDPRPALVELLGAGATPPPGEGQVDAGVHEL